MRKPSGCCRVLLLLIPPLFLLFPVSIITFALDRISNALVLAQTRSDGLIGGYDTSFNGPSFNRSPTIAILGICVLVGVVSVIDVFGIWELRRVEGTARHQRVWAWIILISSVVMAGASSGVMGYATSVQNNEATAELHEDTPMDSFTRETWACAMKGLHPDQSWAAEACGLAKTTRFLLIPMAILSALVLVSLWILVRDRGGLRWLFGGKGRYAGFANVYELRPTSPGARPTQLHPPGALHAVQQWQPQPVGYWPQQSYQQWPQQPQQPGPQQPANQAQEGGPKTGGQTMFR